MQTHTIELGLSGTDLSGRALAKELRREIMCAPGVVELDFGATMERQRLLG